MQYQRQAGRFKTAPGQFGAAGTGGGRQLVAHHMREINAAALQYVAFLQHATGTASAFRSLPGVVHEIFAIDQFQGFNDAVLQALQIVGNSV